MSQGESNKGVNVNREEESSKNELQASREGVLKDEGDSPKETEKEQPKAKEGEGGVLETKENTSGRHVSNAHDRSRRVRPKNCLWDAQHRAQ